MGETRQALDPYDAVLDEIKERLEVLMESVEAVRTLAAQEPDQMAKKMAIIAVLAELTKLTSQVVQKL
jgi:hypothetical protein